MEGAKTTRQDTINVLKQLLDGRMSRDQASRWAYKLYDNQEQEFEAKDEALRDAIYSLILADAITTDRPYLYGPTDFEEWLSQIEVRFPNYSLVQLLTDRFAPEGLKRGDIGYVIEIYDEDAYEVEFSDSEGITRAQIVAHGDELELCGPAHEETGL